MTEAERNRIQQYLDILKAEPTLYQTAKVLCFEKTEDLAKQEGMSGEFARNIYYTVFAPVLICFVEWVLSEAEKKGIRRLYFLARDGYQMYLTAKQICKNRNLDIDCRYLYGSRYAWRMPQYALMGEKSLELICQGGIDVTFEKIMKRGGLTKEEAELVAEEVGYTKDYKKILSYNEVMKLKKALTESKNFLNYVYKHSNEVYEVTIGYLRQEGLLENVPYAIVDVGWIGSQQKMLTQLLQQIDEKITIKGFYFGLYELPQKALKNLYSTYYFNEALGIRRKVYFSSSLLEAVYSASHGMTISYEKNNEGYKPVFYRETNLNQEAMMHMEYWLKRFLTVYQGKTKSENSSVIVYELLRQFMGTPAKEETETYGSLLFSDDVREEKVQEIAVRLSKEELRQHMLWNKICIMLGMKKKTLKESAWPEGSMVRSAKRPTWWLFHVRCYKYIVYFRKRLKKGKLL